MAEESLSALKIKMGIAMGSVTRLKTYYESVDENNLNEKIIAQLNARLNKVEASWDEFNELQTKIEILDSQEAETGATKREHFENLFFVLTADINTTCKKYNEMSDVSVAGSVVAASVRNNNINLQSQSMIKLPTIRLPGFDGNYNNWLEFKDSFAALVDNNESLSDIQKFYYLRSALEGDAVQVIKSIEVSAANYSHAWQLLLDRFKNKKLIIHNHIKAIFEHPGVVKESYTELRKLYDNVIKHLRSLKTLGEKTDEWCNISMVA
ncbi:uncharacterized protein LOC108911101 [Anoplophora glabripennis]|uniref:uncharacterized protein LOC108911101 n=1 Tax=Anoplophora glabripennis TaxID=217634 RepID=UPI0008749711|nr:uncharacterized protein LOC108911101 [Anoplophora glabripennis]